MQTKYNEATLNRPEGDRLLDAPVVTMDFEKYIDQLKKETAWWKNDRNGITIYKTEGMTIVLTCLRKYAAIENNVSNGILTIQVLDGALDFISADISQTLKKNEAVAIHPGIEHTIKAKKDSSILLINTETVQ